MFQCSHAEMRDDLAGGDPSATARKFFVGDSVIRPKKWSTYTLAEVDAFLDSFASVTRELEQVNLMRRFCLRATGMWEPLCVFFFFFFLVFFSCR